MNKEDVKDAAPQLAQVDIGAVLAAKRKAKNLSVESVAKTINLSKDIIKNLENNQFDQIGAVVYVRGYLGLYAKYLNCDSAEIIQIYNTQYPSEDIKLRPAIAPLKGGVRKERKRHSKTFSMLVALLFLGGLIYAYYRVEPLFADKIMMQSGQSQPSLSAEETKTVSNTNMLMNKTSNEQNLAENFLDEQATISTPELISDVELSSIEWESSLNNDLGTSESNEVEEAEVLLTTEIEGMGKVVAVKPSLRITFRADCWLRITDAYGKVVADGVYSSSRPLEVQGKLPMKLNTARASVIKSVMLGDKEISLESNRLSKRRFEIK